MADYDDYAEVLSTFFAHSHNIPIFLEIENYSIWVTKMRFFLGELQAVRLIDADPSQISNRGFFCSKRKTHRIGLIFYDK